MQGQLMPGFGGNGDLKIVIKAHLTAAADGIATLEADASFPPAAREVLVHLHDAIVATAKVTGVGFFD